ncbi:roadblock/LC7 domain-containing protein [Methylocystis sp. B8]|uniref:roadblock/LC7 domain-containing protein n=1 Tax=Methylocystis sp. B8 TaxID=544938 RepID=UPI001485296C|nr:roadblock/LC7 domain-containing protein [Methylocystis sp. B8]
MAQRAFFISRRSASFVSEGLCVSVSYCVSLAKEMSISKYDDLLLRVVARLPDDTPDLRRDAYERARAALIKQLLNLRPPISDANLVAEERAFNEAIERVEANAKAHAAPPLARSEPETQNGDGIGWLSELLKKASRDVPATLAPKRAPTSPLSVMDFAPTRAQIAEPAAQERALSHSRVESERSSVAKEEPSETRAASSRNSLDSILQKLQSESPGVEASALISQDGSMIASTFATTNMEDVRIAGMAATLQSMGTRAATALARGNTREAVVRGTNGYAIMISAGRGALLLAVANDASKLGLIFFNMYEAINSLLAAMESRIIEPEDRGTSLPTHKLSVRSAWHKVDGTK